MSAAQAAPVVQTSLGEPNVVAMLFFNWLVPAQQQPSWVGSAKSKPLLDNLGLEALDEQSYRFRAGDEKVYLYDIGVRVPAGVARLHAARRGARHRLRGDRHP